MGSENRGAKEKCAQGILNPERCKTWNTVRGATDQLEDLIRRYDARKNASGSEKTSDEIKATALELLAPSDIERHLILNKNRLTTCKVEIELVLESAFGSKGSVKRPGESASSSGPAPMDVDTLTAWIASVVKGPGKGKGKPKGRGD